MRRAAWILLLLLPVTIMAQNVKDLELEDISGETFVLTEHLDYDATIISFWATWCIPCMKEHPALKKLKENLAEEGKKVQIIAISTDSPRSLAKVKKYIRSRKYPFVFLLDPNGEYKQELLITDIPYTIVVDNQGTVFYTHSGYRKGDEQELIKNLWKHWGRKEHE